MPARPGPVPFVRSALAVIVAAVVVHAPSAGSADLAPRIGAPVVGDPAPIAGGPAPERVPGPTPDVFPAPRAPFPDGPRLPVG